MSEQTTAILIITGPVGVGKSAIADEAFELLCAQRKPVALVNLDELGYAYPKPADDPYQIRLRFRNLATTWENYHAVGVKAVIIPWVIESAEDLELFRKAIPGAKLYTIRLDAPLKVLRDRIQNRPMGGVAEWHHARAEELTRLYDERPVGDAVIGTENRTPNEIANEVIEHWTDLRSIAM